MTSRGHQSVIYCKLAVNSKYKGASSSSTTRSFTACEDRVLLSETHLHNFQTMFKVPDHQVGGHMAGNGVLGPLVDDAGNFYKPLQSDERGAKEVAFYTGLSTETRIPDEIRKFFPVFHGTRDLEASDGSGLHPHLVLEDIVSSRTNPSILDIKIGASTWYPEASEQYITKCLKKDRDGTSLTLGFRLCGLQFYGNKETGFWKPDRKSVNAFTHDDVLSALRKFVSSNSPSDSDAEPDCSYASTVYGGPDGIVSQLLKLKSWFEDQTIYHFYSCSIMMVYDKESILKGENPNPQIKLVDFAHVMEGKGIIDHNFLGGLCSLIKFLKDVLNNPKK